VQSPSEVEIATLALVALSVTLGLQVFRVQFPLSFDLGEDIGFVEAGLITVAVFGVGPLLAEPIRRLLGPRDALWTAFGGAVTGRLLIQFVHPVPFWLATASTVLALFAWTLLVISLRARGREGSGAFVMGTLLGLSLDTAVRTVFRTWDPAWQSGALAIALTLALAAGVGILLARTVDRLSAAERPRGGALALTAIGPFLFLEVVFLQSPAFAASQAGVSVPFAATAILVGDALAITAVSWGGVQRVSSLGTLAAATGLILATAVMLQWVAPTIALVLIVAQPLAAELLAASISSEDRTSTALSTSLGVAAGALLFLAFAVAYQIHYDTPLPFPNEMLPPVAAAILAFGAYRGGQIRAGARREWLYAAAPILLIVVPALVRIAAPVRQGTEGNGASFRLVNYNVHMGVNTRGQVDLEAIASAIEAENPDVVTLQEVARGWATNGTTDVASWLSARLEMRYVYGPAADGQFGNAVLSRLPIIGSTAGELPQSTGSMTRGYVEAVLDIDGIGGSRTLRVFSTHLQNEEANEPARMAEIPVLLDAWAGVPRTVIAGDMNAEPHSAEIEALTDAGLSSAQDEAGNPGAPTSWIDGTRIDYVFGSEGVKFDDFDIGRTRASDHLPMAVTVGLA
jgi:endonuclease/exonuclease/phosphatase family metal-dependent hydrolase